MGTGGPGRMTTKDQNGRKSSHPLLNIGSPVLLDDLEDFPDPRLEAF